MSLSFLNRLNACNSSFVKLQSVSEADGRVEAILLLMSSFPYDSKSMGLIWQFMAHIWPICGKDMEWLLDCMELIW